jgi:hypothetical protein
MNQNEKMMKKEINGDREKLNMKRIRIMKENNPRYES